MTNSMCCQINIRCYFFKINIVWTCAGRAGKRNDSADEASGVSLVFGGRVGHRPLALRVPSAYAAAGLAVVHDLFVSRLEQVEFVQKFSYIQQVNSMSSSLQF